jgi:hypothetical protein
VTPLDIVTFKWRTPGYRSTFGPAAVNTLKRMLARHYPHPHRLTCITDDPAGIDADVRVLPLWNDLAEVPNPSGPKGPSCFRRLKLFAPEMAEVIGPRFAAIDLDVVIVGDLTKILQREEDFVSWGGTHPRTPYNGSLLLMTAGARARVWETFNPATSPARACAAGFFGSDQGWISYCLGPSEPRWTSTDGVCSFRLDCRPNWKLPAHAKMVFFHGARDPWDHQAQQLGWVRAHYR